MQTAWKAKLDSLLNRVTELEGAATPATIPVGTVLTYAASTAPSGYLVCNGAAVSRQTYWSLFQIIGITHGQGDGSTTFNIPDYRGRILRMVDGAAGRDPDSATRTAMATGGVTGNNIGSVQADAVKIPSLSFTTDSLLLS